MSHKRLANRTRRRTKPPRKPKPRRKSKPGRKLKLVRLEPRLTLPMILAWADAFYRRSGTWPHNRAGTINSPGGRIPGLTWAKVNTALMRGLRGLTGKTSLAQELRRPVAFTSARTPCVSGRSSPGRGSISNGPDAGRPPATATSPAPGEKWHALDFALTAGLRGLPGGSSLSRLIKSHEFYQLSERQRNRIPASRRLSSVKIMVWAKAHRRRTGIWPHRASGPIPGAPGLTWQIVDAALRGGHRGLVRGSSLARLFGRKKPQLSR